MEVTERVTGQLNSVGKRVNDSAEISKEPRLPLRDSSAGRHGNYVLKVILVLVVLVRTDQ